jgi:two-component system, OmpR family, lantibiotic biosynthesis sensor histidine kinase NisK/SpaK
MYINSLGCRVQVGKTKLIGRLSLKGQVIVTIMMIILSSLLATILTFTCIVLIAKFTGHSYRGLEQKVPRLVAEQGVQILNRASAPYLEQQLNGFPYQVVDAQGRVLYGSIQTPILQNRTDLVQRINTTEIKGPLMHGFGIIQPIGTKYFPVYDQNGLLRGAIIIRIQLSVISANPSVRDWINFLTYLVPALPFLYFCLFSYLFAKRFGKRINQPLQALVQAAQRIQQQDLDFRIEQSGNHEIGQLLTAFENMRVELKNSLLKQWQMEEERRHIIAAISHDLRTPLTIVQGHVESLLDGAMHNPERLERYLKTVFHNTKRIIYLTEEMREISEIDKPDFTLHPTDVDVSKFFTDWIRDFEFLVEQAGVNLEADLQDVRAEQKPMRLDPKRISQVLDNIGSNSVRFTPAGGTIRIQIRIEDQMITCTMSDTGKGFSKRDLGHVFDRFYQGDSARSEAGHSGLGLYIAKIFVLKHGGTITADNTPEGGAIITFTIRDQR